MKNYHRKTAATDEQKLLALFAYCRRTVNDTMAGTSEQVSERIIELVLDNSISEPEMEYPATSTIDLPRVPDPNRIVAPPNG